MYILPRNGQIYLQRNGQNMQKDLWASVFSVVYNFISIHHNYATEMSTTQKSHLSPHAGTKNITTPWSSPKVTLSTHGCYWILPVATVSLCCY